MPMTRNFSYLLFPRILSMLSPSFKVSTTISMDVFQHTLSFFLLIHPKPNSCLLVYLKFTTNLKSLIHHSSFHLHRLLRQLPLLKIGLLFDNNLFFSKQIYSLSSNCLYNISIVSDILLTLKLPPHHNLSCSIKTIRL